MFKEKTISLYAGSNDCCRLKQIPGCNRDHLLDPSVIGKVEKSGVFLTDYEKAPFTPFMDLSSLRLEMGSENLDITQELVEEIPFLIRLCDRFIPVTFFRLPNGQMQKPVIFFHGGGFLGGSTKVLENQCKFLAEQSKATVISVDYRLIPENPFPAALNDCKEVISWIWDHAEEWNLDRNKITAAGESAGGNLAVSCSLSETGKKVALTMPVYGALDLSYAEDTDYWDYHKYEVIPEHYNHAMTRLNRFRILNNTIHDLYAANGEDVKDPSISPLYTNDLSNLKKTVIVEAEFDYFRLSNDLFAEKLWNSKIPCEVIRYQGMDHGFYDRLGFCQQTKDCIMEMALQIRKL